MAARSADGDGFLTRRLSRARASGLTTASSRGLGRSAAARPSANARFDVAIVGGGLNALWTAYDLRRRDPDALGSPCSKRDRGLSASAGTAVVLRAVPASAGALEVGTESTRRSRCGGRWSTRSTRSVGSRAEGIDCDYVRGGTSCSCAMPRNAGREAEVAEARRYGSTGPSTGTSRRVGLAVGDTTRRRRPGRDVDPACARVHPAKLVRGLARVVESRGSDVRAHGSAGLAAGRSVPALDGATPGHGLPTARDRGDRGVRGLTLPPCIAASCRCTR